MFQIFFFLSVIQQQKQCVVYENVGIRFVSYMYHYVFCDNKRIWIKKNTHTKTAIQNFHPSKLLFYEVVQKALSRNKPTCGLISVQYHYTLAWNLVFHFIFIRPFEKWTYYAMAMSVCPSVCPSVRVFRTFCQHALRYQFETWCMYSVGGTTCRVWVAL